MPSIFFPRSISPGVRIDQTQFEKELKDFLTNATPEQKKYSLRAIKEIGKDANGKKCTIYRLFKRDGTEDFLDRVANWLWQNEQRANAREAIKAGFSFSDDKLAADFYDEINGMERVLPGEDLKNILMNRQFNPDAPQKRNIDLKGKMENGNIGLIAPSDTLNLISRIESHPAAANALHSTDINRCENATGFGGAVLTETDVKSSVTINADFPEAGKVSNHFPVMKRVTPKKGLLEQKNRMAPEFSLQSLFESALDFGRANEKASKVIFSKMAGAAANSVAQAKQRRANYGNGEVTQKGLPDEEPSGNYRPAKAQSIRAIEVKHMPDLDVQDLHPSVAVLMRNTNDYFAMTKECREWLQRRAPKIQGGVQDSQPDTIAKIERGENIAYLAPHAERDPNRKDFKKHLAGIASFYKQAINDAVSNGRPIVLTPLFHYDEETIDQYLTAMLRPVYAHLKANGEVRLEIRTTCRKTAEALEKYRRQYPTSPLNEKGNPASQLKSRLHEVDLESEGMIMMTPEILALAGRRSRKVLSEAGARFSADPRMERVQPRKRLAQNAWSRCYYFADRFSEAESRVDARFETEKFSRKPASAGGVTIRKISNEIAACYRAAFMEARQNDCRFLTLPSLENRFDGLLSDEAAAVQVLGTLRRLKAEFPDICVTVLSQNPHIKANFALLESAD